jgi:hypothetical protein
MTSETVPAGAGGAIISDCGLYRYHLWRALGMRYMTDGRGPRIVWVMLNPSTADATTNDRTIETCMDFSRRWGMEYMEVVNLYGLRATDPAELWKSKDPTGALNDDFIRRAVSTAMVTICAWGQNAKADRVRAVLPLLPKSRRALALNKDGSPKHPLYIARNTALVDFP